MKRIIVLLLLLMVLVPGTEAQIVTEDTLNFYDSDIVPNVVNGSTGSYVLIKFYAHWNLTGASVTANDSIIVYFGADFSHMKTDWLLESEFDETQECFIANFTYSEDSVITFYVSEILLLPGYANVGFTQAADNITIQWSGEVITQVPNKTDWTLLIQLMGAFMGVLVVILIYFKKERDQYNEYHRTAERKRKMQ